MRRLLAVLAVACLVPLATARAEDEPKTYDLHTWSVVWKAGDTATVKTDDSSPSVMKITQADPKTGKETTTNQEHMTQQDSTYVVQCLEADDEGRATKALVHVAEWKQTVMQKAEGKESTSEPDTSAKGLHLEVTVKDGARSYRVLTPGAKPSKAAQAWLEATFGNAQKAKWVLDLDLLGRPAEPVKVDDAWTGDPTKLDFGLPLDAPASTVKVKLAGVTDGAMRLKVELRLKAAGLPAGGAVVPFTEGGMFESDYAVTHSLAPHTFDSSQTVMASLKGTASQPGIKMEVEFGNATEIQTKTGGEMPKPPGEKPADAPK